MKTLQQLLAQVRPEVDFSVSPDFFADGLLDSFDLITLVTALTDEYGVSIGGSDIVPENFCNLQAIAAMLRRHGVHP